MFKLNVNINLNEIFSSFDIVNISVGNMTVSHCQDCVIADVINEEIQVQVTPHPVHVAGHGCEYAQ